MSNELDALKLVFDWSHQRDADGDDFLFTYGNAKDALLYSILFFPETVEIEGSVLLKSALKSASNSEELEQNFLAFKQKEGKAAAEKSFNLIELPYIFGDLSIDLPNEVFDALAKQIGRAWRSWLSHCYPGREFEVETLKRSDDGATTIYLYELEQRG